MSVRSRVCAFDRRHRERGWYVFAQIYLLGNLLSTVIYYGFGFALIPDFFVGLGIVLNAAFILSLFIFPDVPSPEYTAGMLIVGTVLIFWRYHRLYRTEGGA